MCMSCALPSSSPARVATSPTSRASLWRSDYHSETQDALRQPRRLILTRRHSFETEGSSPVWLGTCMGSQREPNPERQRYRAAGRASRKCPQGLGTPYKTMGLVRYTLDLLLLRPREIQAISRPHTEVDLRYPCTRVDTNPGQPVPRSS